MKKEIIIEARKYYVQKTYFTTEIIEVEATSIDEAFDLAIDGAGIMISQNEQDFEYEVVD